jgi:hypothetical protein
VQLWKWRSSHTRCAAFPTVFRVSLPCGKRPCLGTWYPQPRTPSTPDAPFTLQLEPQFSAKIQTLLQQEEEAGRSGSRDRRDAVGHRVDVQVRVWIHHPLMVST